VSERRPSGAPNAAPAWRRYVRFWGADVEADVDDELRFHLESRVQDLIAEGMDPARAREESMRRFGDVPRIRDACRRIGHQGERVIRVGEIVGTVRQDVVFAIRQLARNRAFTLAAVLTLALGIGANSAIFSLVDAVVLHPLPGIRDPQRLAEIGYSISYPLLEDLRRDARAQIELAGFSSRPMAISGSERPRTVRGVVVTGNYFSVLGARVSLGRPILPADDQGDGSLVAVVSDAFWRRELEANPSVLGRTLMVNGVPLQIVGVAEPGFRGSRLSNMEVWVPLHAWPQLAPTSFGRKIEQRGWSWINAIGRLQPGVEPAQALAVLNATSKRQKELYPTEGRSNWQLELVPAAQRILGGGKWSAVVGFATMLMAVVGLVLLLACANVANLLLARAAHRRREIAVRLALGAGRGRLVRQLLTESLVLALTAAAVGVAVMPAIVRVLARETTPAMFSPESLGADIGVRALAFTAVVALLAAVIFGLTPALQTSRASHMSALKDGTAGGGHQRSRTRDMLLTLQVAFCLVLLVGAGLFTRSLVASLRADLGFRTEHLALATVEPGLARYDPVRASAFYVEAGDRLRALPGVKGVTWTSVVPMTDSYDTGSADIEGYAKRPDEDIELEYATVGADYFSVLGIPLVGGRDFGALDVYGRAKTIIINETMARRYWKNGDAVGRRVIMVGDDTVTVVGVVRDAKYHTLSEPPQSYVYRPLAQRRVAGQASTTLIVRTDGSSTDEVLAALPRELRAVAPTVPVSGLGTFADRFDDLLMPQRFAAALLGFFSALALVIAAVGVYGVVAYAVSQRTREIGIRVALGAQPGSVVGLVLGRSLRDVVIGVLIGLALAVAATRAVVGLLYGVTPTDATTFIGTSLVLMVVAIMAALGPARRAARTDPANALRS
jgi:predicted permease